MAGKSNNFGLDLASLVSRTMSSFLKIRGLWVLLITLLCFAMSASALYFALDSIGTRHAGFLPFENLRVGAFIRGDWAGADRDLRYSDQISSVNGRQFDSAKMFQSYLEGQNEVDLRLERSSFSEQTFAVSELTAVDVFSIFTPLFGTGVAFLGIALLLLLIFPSPPGIIHLVSFCLATGVFFLFAYDFHTTYVWTTTYLLAFAWIAPSVLNLTWSFPEQQDVPNAWRWGTYLLAGILSLPYVNYFHTRPDLWRWVELMVISYVSVAYLYWFYSTFRTSRKSKNQAVRDQARILLIPVALAFGLTFCLSWAIVGLGYQLPFYWLAPLSLVFPLTISYSILRKNLFWLRNLEEEVDTRTRQLEESRRELHEASRMASVGTLAAGMAHEIGNAIHLIKSNLPILRDYVEKLLAGKKEEQDFIREDTPELLRNLESGADRTVEIVNDLKNFAKPEEKGKSLVDLTSLIQSAHRLLRPKLNSKIQVREELSEVPKLMLNASQMHQVLINLILNAIDAIDETGEISIKLWKGAGAVHLWIADDGCGMTLDELEHCFDPFFTRKEKGSGLGLSIVQGLVAVNGGQIRAESEKEQGSTFKLRFPLE